MNMTVQTLVPGKTDRVSPGVAAFRRIFLPLDTHTTMAGVFEEMRLSAMIRLPGEPAEGMFIKEPSGSAKSTVANRFCRRVEQLVGAEFKKGPVRLVTVGEEGTAKTFWSSILEHLGDPYYATGSEANLKKRVQKALKREKVVLLIVDELNHTVDKSHAGQILNAIKNMLTLGWVSIVAMGSSAELDRLPQNDSFQGRMVESPGLPRLVWSDHAETWSTFCTKLDEQLVERLILRSASDLGTPARSLALCNICEGLIGRLMWLVETALRNTLRRDADCISLVDLVSAGNALLRKYPREGAVNPLAALC
ncbi:TniB family NTP-binding protein [Sphingomonas citri]